MNLRGFGPPTLINRSLKLNMRRQGLSDSSFENYEPTEKKLENAPQKYFCFCERSRIWKFHFDQIASDDSEIQARKFNWVKDPS